MATWGGHNQTKDDWGITEEKQEGCSSGKTLKISPNQKDQGDQEKKKEKEETFGCRWSKELKKELMERFDEAMQKIQERDEMALEELGHPRKHL